MLKFFCTRPPPPAPVLRPTSPRWRYGSTATSPRQNVVAAVEAVSSPPAYIRRGGGPLSSPGVTRSPSVPPPLGLPPLRRPPPARPRRVGSSCPRQKSSSPAGGAPSPAPAARPPAAGPRGAPGAACTPRPAVRRRRTPGARARALPSPSPPRQTARLDRLGPRSDLERLTARSSSLSSRQPCPATPACPPPPSFSCSLPPRASLSASAADRPSRPPSRPPSRRRGRGTPLPPKR